MEEKMNNLNDAYLGIDIIPKSKIRFEFEKLIDYYPCILDKDSEGNYLDRDIAIAWDYYFVGALASLRIARKERLFKESI
jgi:hypothetical protein